MAPRVLTPVILCGGAGTRLWPVSREDVPKQFVSLLGGRTSFQDTLLRVRDQDLFAAPLVITNERYATLAASQLQEVGVQARLVIEPARRDSGPAIAACAALVAREDPATPLMMLPSDHVVRDEAAFRAAARKALEGVDRGYIVTFGVRPDHPATGYGYILPGRGEVGSGLRSVARFVEKPDPLTALRYLAEGYLWNSGNFVFRADVLLSEYEARDRPTVEAAEAAVARAEPRCGGVLLDRAAFERCEAKSIDYAVIEGSSRVAVIPVSMGWSDVGSWEAVWDLSDKDKAGNVAHGRALFVGARDNLVHSSEQLVCVVGATGLKVIVTPDAVLVIDGPSETSVRTVIARLRALDDPGLKQALSVSQSADDRPKPS